MYEGKIYLPRFVVQENGSWRDVSFEMDILSRINWRDADITGIKNIPLSELKAVEQEVAVGLSEDEKSVIEERKRVSRHGGLEIDPVFITRQLLDIVPNPWTAYDIGKDVVDAFLEKFSKQKVADNLVFIIEEIKKQLERERDRLSEIVFIDLVERKKLWFFLLADKGGYELPNSIRIKKQSRKLVRDDNSEVQRSLFDYMPEDDFNDMEKSIAIYLDKQEQLLWWYRNMSRQDYYIQGWKRNKVYPDFIFTRTSGQSKDYSKVFVVETKGTHLKNEDTAYKKSVFKFCNELGKKKEWKELNKEFSKGIEFQVVYEDEWQKRINEIFRI